MDHLAPGTVIKRRLEVSSTSDDSLHVEVYAGAAEIKDAAMSFGLDRTPNELSSWVSLDKTDLDLPPHGAAQVRATITVPPPASTGERYAVIWAQVASPTDSQHNVRIVNRVGVRIYLDVGPGGEPPSDFRIESLTPARTPDGQPELLAQVDNTGKRAVDLSGQLWLSNGPGSMSAGPFRVATGTTLAPGNKARVKVLLDHRLPSGPWTARLTLTSGLIQRTTTATVTFPNRAGTTGASLLANSSTVAAGVLMLVVVVLGLAVLLFTAGRHRLRRR